MLLATSVTFHSACCMVLSAACQYFAPKVFEECCSPTQIGVTQCPDNSLALQAQLRLRVFQGCTALQHLDLGKKGQGSTNLNLSLPDCCFLEAGIVALYLPLDLKVSSCKLKPLEGRKGSQGQFLQPQAFARHERLSRSVLATQSLCKA